MRSWTIGTVTCLFAVLGLSAYEAQRPSTAKAAALVNGSPVPLSELEEPFDPRAARLQEQVHALQLQILELAIDRRLIASEAARRRLSPAQLQAAVAEQAAKEVTDADIAQYLASARESVPPRSSPARVSTEAF